MADLVLAKWRRGIDSSLEEKSIENGNIYLSKDTKRLHIDIDDERIEVTDFIKETESEILSTLSPLPKFYYATDTYRLWYYDSDDESWHSLSVTNAETAEKAVADSEGNVINETYATNEEVNNEISRLESIIEDLVGFTAQVVDELPAEGENGVLYLVPHDGSTESNYYDEYVWVEVDSSFELIGSTEIDLENYVTTDGEQALTNKTYEGYTLNNSVEYDVTDNTTPTALEEDDSNLVTGESVYNALPKINDSHNYDADDTFYAPTEAGDSGYILQSDGTDTPIWVNPDTVTTKHIDVDVTDDTTSSTSLESGDSFEAVDSVSRDEYGHVTSIDTVTVTLPNVSANGYYGKSDDDDTETKSADIVDEDFTLRAGTIVAITFATEVTADATLDIADTGAKEIYQMGEAIKDDVIQAGATCVFIYDGSHYLLLCCDSDAGGNYIEEGEDSDGGGLKPLAECTVQEIQAIAQSGQAEKCWSVGDTYPITLNGTVGAYTFDNETWYAEIIGFNHNAELETGGLPSVTFQFGQAEDGTEIAFTDDRYNSYGSSDCFVMKNSTSNSGGWESSYMRNTICSEFLEAMPTEWQDIIKPTIKYTDNVGGGSGSVESNVTATEDKIFLLNEYEVSGVGGLLSNAYEANYTKPYSDKYGSDSDRIRYRHSVTDTTCSWWGRSNFYLTSSYFGLIDTYGAINVEEPNRSSGFAPAFTIF